MALGKRLLSARARLRGAAPIDRNVAEILERYHVGRYPTVRRWCARNAYKLHGTVIGWES